MRRSTEHVARTLPAVAQIFVSINSSRLRSVLCRNSRTERQQRRCYSPARRRKRGVRETGRLHCFQHGGGFVLSAFDLPRRHSYSFPALTNMSASAVCDSEPVTSARLAANRASLAHSDI
ncbi:hypothetical protein LSAT2_007916 [Lamellibrachia satsuma]|nr:hypothetical protein LSAT2_007916 [Lamellibrachia satsuma]